MKTFTNYEKRLVAAALAIVVIGLIGIIAIEISYLK
jgi:preprotein translocase subunit Sss1